MRKSTRIVKKYIATFLVVLMGINTFGAVVSDNDGAAFITKAEFDSLRNDFQSQIDQYNTSIDAKIDGAIASYLAGISFAPKEDLPILVPGYENMRWHANWKLYGKFKKWSDYDHFVELESNQWHEPNFAERRVNTRGTIAYIDDISTCQGGSVAVCLTGSLKYFGGNAMQANGANNAIHGQADAPPVACINLKKVNDEWILQNNNDLFYFWFSCPMYIHGQPKPRNRIGGATDIYNIIYTNVVGDDTKSPWFVINNNPGAVLDYTIYWKGTSYGWSGWYTKQIEKDNVDFPYSYTNKNMYMTSSDDKGYSTTSSLGLSDEDKLDVFSLVNAGVSWEWIDPATYNQQVSNFYYMMLGKDNDQNVNLRRNYASDVSYAILDAKDTNQYAKVITNVEGVTFSSLRRYSPETVSQTPYNQDVSVNIPLLPIASISQLTNGLWKFNGVPLKMGQGFPLLMDANDAGYVQISFDYAVKRDFPTPDTNHRIVFC